MSTVSDHLMDEASAVEILDAFVAGGVEPCVGGGWAIDALLGEQTRAHADLDVWLPATSFDRAVEVFVRVGIDRLYPWGDDRPWNLVVHDGARRRVDLHLYEILANGELHYGGVETGETFPAAALQGSGALGGRPVRCEAPEWALRWHTGYPPRREDLHDIPRLCARFGLDCPAELRQA
jgi:lincosamide nucleotidyltransferase A/C/D/E